MKVIGLVLFLSVNLYSPYSVLTPLLFNLMLVVFFMFFSKGRPQISKFEIQLISFALIPLIWIVVVSGFHWGFDSYAVGRFFRGLTNLILVSVIIKNLRFNQKQILYAIGFTLLFNVIAVYVQTLVPSTKPLFQSISGYEKTLFDLRAFGLFSSYDSAGFCACLCIVFWGLMYIAKKNIVYIAFSFLPLVACLMISRFSMLVAALCFLVIGSVMLRRTKPIYAISIFLPIALVVGYYFYDQAWFIIEASISGDKALTSSYSSSSSSVLLDNMIFFPDNIVSLFFGEGIDPTLSDIGYIKLIFMVGVLGTLFICWTYFYVFKYLKKRYHRNLFVTDNDKMMYQFICAFIVLLFVFNSKLLFFYGRGFHDLFIILVFAFYKTTYQKPEIRQVQYDRS